MVAVSLSWTVTFQNTIAGFVKRAPIPSTQWWACDAVSISSTSPNSIFPIRVLINFQKISIGIKINQCTVWHCSAQLGKKGYVTVIDIWFMAVLCSQLTSLQWQNTKKLFCWPLNWIAVGAEIGQNWHLYSFHRDCSRPSWNSKHVTATQNSNLQQGWFTEFPPYAKFFLFLKLIL